MSEKMLEYSHSHGGNSRDFCIPMNIKQRINKLWTAVKKSPLEAGLLVLMTFLVGYGLTPDAANATVRSLDWPVVDKVTSLRIAAMQNQLKDYGVLPKPDLRGPSYSMTITATAYNSLPEQTDDTPFITASGTHVRHGVIAANFLPIGTRIKIPEYYGDQVFIVEDRMNPRYHQRLDIWMESVTDARQFGVRNVTIEVYR